MSILPEGVRRWVDPRPAGVAAARVRAEAERERFFLLFPPLMLSFRLADQSFGGPELAWGAYFKVLLVAALYSLIFYFIWKNIWGGRIPRRLPYWRTFVLGLLASVLGSTLFPLLEAVGVPHF